MWTSYPTYVARFISEKDLSIGYTKLGNAHIQCTLLGPNSQWGVLKGKQNDPKGVLLFFRLSFIQPDKYSLRYAEVSMEFAPSVNGGISGPSVDEFQPIRMVGMAHERHEVIDQEFNPRFDAGSLGGGEIGSYHRSMDQTRLSRWVFSGDRKASRNQNYLTTAFWKLEDSTEDGRDTEHPFTTAAVLQLERGAEEKSFLLKLGVNAKFKSKFSNLRYSQQQLKLKEGTIQSTELIPELSDVDLSPRVQNLAEYIREVNSRRETPVSRDIRPEDTLPRTSRRPTLEPQTNLTAVTQTTVEETQRVINAASLQIVQRQSHVSLIALAKATMAFALFILALLWNVVRTKTGLTMNT